MPTLLDYHVSTVSLTWLNYVILVTAIVMLCGGAFVCVHCSLINTVFSFTSFCLNSFREILTTLPLSREGTNVTGINHHILDIRPEYGVDVNQIINDIVGVLNRSLLDYTAPESSTKYRSPTRKFDVRGWRRKLNERWKKKRKFVRTPEHKHVSSNMFLVESKDRSQRDGTESSSYSNSSKNHSEEFILTSQSDEDPYLDETITFPSQIRKLTLFKAKPDGSLVPHYEVNEIHLYHLYK